LPVDEELLEGWAVSGAENHGIDDERAAVVRV
jgi:hypothetical protein